MTSAYDRLPLGALRVFEAAATQLSFSAAAEALNVTPAAVSQQIKALEAYIQVPLFRRNGRRVELTDEGCELLPAVRAGLEKLESAMQQIKQHRRAGPLQITTIASFLQIWLLPRIRSFRRKYPNVELRFHTSRDLVDFSRTTNHVAIRLGRGDYPNLHSEKFMEDWLVPVASPDLIKQYGMIERGAKLNKFPLLESGDEPWTTLESNRRRGRVAVARAEHRRFRRLADGGRRGPGLRTDAVDCGFTRAAERHAAARGPRRPALRPGLLFRVSQEFPGAAESRAVSRVDLCRGARFPPARRLKLCTRRRSMR